MVGAFSVDALGLWLQWVLGMEVGGSPAQPGTSLWKMAVQSFWRQGSTLLPKRCGQLGPQALLQGQQVGPSESPG